MNAKRTDLSLTLEDAAREFHVTRETIRRRLRAAESEYKAGDRLSIYEVHVAMVGDLHAEKIRLTRAQADLAELERKKREKELVTMDEAKRVLSDRFIPLRTQLLAMPSVMAARCNPSDPELARKAIDERVREILQRSAE